MSSKILIIAALCLAAVLAVPTEGCGPNEVYLDCGTPCPEHCPTLNTRTGQLETSRQFCVKMCQPGCFCADGFVRDLKRSNACVQKSVCSPP